MVRVVIPIERQAIAKPSLLTTKRDFSILIAIAFYCAVVLLPSLLKLGGNHHAVAWSWPKATATVWVPWLAVFVLAVGAALLRQFSSRRG